MNASVRLSNKTEYVDYGQQKKRLFCYKNKVFVTHSLAFFDKDKREISNLENSIFLINEGEMETLKENKSVFLLF